MLIVISKPPNYPAALLIVADHLQRRSATADSSCGEFARFNRSGRTRCGELGAHYLLLGCRLFQGGSGTKI
jgi:hypothetical protein